MKRLPNLNTILVASAVLITTAAIFFYAFYTARRGRGLVTYFAKLGIELDYTAIIVALGMIPVFWLVAYAIRSWTMKWK